MIDFNKTRPTWWGDFELADGQAGQWQINALRLTVQRLANEWLIAYEYDPTVDWNLSDWSYQICNDLLVRDMETGDKERYVFKQLQPACRLMPLMADRPLISQPITPLYLPAKEESDLFTSVPLWVRLEVGQPPRPLRELPIRRPSDTWFGPSTIEGELCYASRTSGRLHLENMPRRIHRAITKVTIYNQATDPLQVDRLSLPVMYLSLFSTPDGLLWTEDVTMVRSRNTSMASMNVIPGPPTSVSEAQPVSDARLDASRNMAVRAFAALFN